MTASGPAGPERPPIRPGVPAEKLVRSLPVQENRHTGLSCRPHDTPLRVDTRRTDRLLLGGDERVEVGEEPGRGRLDGMMLDDPGSASDIVGVAPLVLREAGEAGGERVAAVVAGQRRRQCNDRRGVDAAAERGADRDIGAEPKADRGEEKLAQPLGRVLVAGRDVDATRAPVRSHLDTSACQAEEVRPREPMYPVEEALLDRRHQPAAEIGAEGVRPRCAEVRPGLSTAATSDAKTSRSPSRAQ